MTPKQKAEQLVEKCTMNTTTESERYAKKLALITVDEILDALFVIPDSMRYMGGPTYWIEVKKEIEKL